MRKKLSSMHIKRFNTFFKRWVQFRVGAIPRLPKLATNFLTFPFLLIVCCISDPPTILKLLLFMHFLFTYFFHLNKLLIGTS